MNKFIFQTNLLKRKKSDGLASISGVIEPKKARKRIPPKPDQNQGAYLLVLKMFIMNHCNY